MIRRVHQNALRTALLGRGSQGFKVESLTRQREKGRLSLEGGHQPSHQQNVPTPVPTSHHTSHTKKKRGKRGVPSRALTTPCSSPWVLDELQFLLEPPPIVLPYLLILEAALELTREERMLQ